MHVLDVREPMMFVSVCARFSSLVFIFSRLFLLFYTKVQFEVVLFYLYSFKYNLFSLVNIKVNVNVLINVNIYIYLFLQGPPA